MTSPHILSYIRLIRTKGVGCITARKLIEAHHGVDGALNYLEHTSVPVYSPQDAEREINAHKKMGAHLITWESADYPPLLKQIPDAPIVMSILGHPHRLNLPCIGIVGARHASLHSLKFTRQLAHDLGQYGYTIVSGLARGIDGAAHTGSLSSGTIAVVAGGVDTLYPREHAELRTQIIDNGGAIVSDMPLGIFPGASHFPRRNRLISGLSQGVCVIEATKQSGSMITARYALDQGRDVFAVPGFPWGIQCGGSNQLLRDGAYFLESAQDVIDVLGAPHNIPKHAHIGHNPNTSSHTNIPSTLFQSILNLIGEGSLSMDELESASHVEIDTLHRALLDLEIQGRIQRNAYGLFVRID